MEIVVATSNNHKLQELRKILPESFKISGMRDIGCLDEIPETGATFRENDLQKGRYLFEKYHVTCLADDSGLEVKALNGRPGVLSARYAGTDADSSANMTRLLSEMNGVADRSARFVTVLALILNGQEYLFEGMINGRITETPSGIGGFGYDPVFIPDGYNTTFSEMTSDQKNSISHRAIAAGRLNDFLKHSVLP